MGRNRKFEVGDKAEARIGPRDYNLVTIIDYKQDSRGRGRYQVLFSDKMVTRWYEGAYLIPAEAAPAPRTVTKVLKNNAIPDRGCDCHCCIHVAVQPSDISLDGEFKWEQ